MSLEERLHKDIFGSRCFDTARREFQLKGIDFDSYVAEKVIPIHGDLIQENLDMSAQDRERITSEAQVVINCAASVDFNLQLNLAVEINIDGAVRMQDLARECKHLEVFCHVSTAYVNCDDIKAAPEGRTIPEMIVKKDIDA